MGRSKIAQTVRRKVLRQHGERCFYCHRTVEQIGFGEFSLTCDHVVPVYANGLPVVSSLVPACRSCNGQKSSRSQAKFIQHLAFTGKILMKRDGSWYGKGDAEYEDIKSYLDSKDCRLYVDPEIEAIIATLQL